MTPVPDTSDTTGKRTIPNPSDPLYHPSVLTLPVDFHTFRWAFSTALASAGVNAQRAMKLASHSDEKTRLRYVMNTPEMRAIPDAAVPQLPAPPGPLPASDTARV